jgi:hypothetical protein
MYPTSVEISPELIKKLTVAYREAYKQIAAEIEGATSFGVANRKAILANIREILKGFGQEVDGLIVTEITDSYKEGALDAVKQLKKIGAEIEVSSGFNRIHNNAIAALVSDTSTAFAESMQGVNRSATNLINRGIRDQITQQMATGQVSGAALRNVKNSVAGLLQNEGLDSLVDKRGASWTLDRYAEMLIRTKTVEARNRGLVNRMVENNYDLVQVSSHGASDECADWEGEILSVSGDTAGYDTVSDAEAGGLFHPNCRHAINALVLPLARELMGWDPDSQSYTKGIIED